MLRSSALIRNRGKYNSNIFIARASRYILGRNYSPVSGTILNGQETVPRMLLRLVLTGNAGAHAQVANHESASLSRVGTADIGGRECDTQPSSQMGILC